MSILEGLVDAEDLARELRKMREAGKSIAGLATSVGDLNSEVQKFTVAMDALASDMAENIEEDTRKIEVHTEESELADIDVDEELARYLGEAGKDQPAVKTAKT